MKGIAVMFSAAVLLAAALTLSDLSADLRSPVITDRCSLVEINHFHDELGHLVFIQLIFYDWSDSSERFQVRAWRMATACNDRLVFSRLPSRDFKRGGYVAIFMDGGVLRSVRASMFRETWTQFDPEVAERDILSRDERRELSKVERKAN